MPCGREGLGEAAPTLGEQRPAVERADGEAVGRQMVTVQFSNSFSPKPIGLVLFHRYICGLKTQTFSNLIQAIHQGANCL